MTRALQVCGTNGGYQRHLKRGEEPCEPCRVAKADWQRRYRSRTDQTEARLVQAARHRAHARLSAIHSGEFEALLIEEIRRGRGAA